MLENRPIVQRSLIGFGAFSFIFTAAMAGTAFMISGGFDFGGNERPRPQNLQQYAVATETAWNEWTQPAYAAVTPSEPIAAPEAVYEPAAYADEELDGEARGHERVEARSEADILRDIQREMAADGTTPAYADDLVEDTSYADPEADIIAQKERAAAMEGYGAY